MSLLRPLRLGELIDRSAAFWREHWRPLFALAVGFQLVQFILLKVNEVISRRVFPVLTGDVAALSKANPVETLSQLVGALGLLVVVALAILLVSQVAGVATTHYVYPRLLQRAGPDLRSSVSLALGRLGTTLLAFLMSVGWTLVVGVGFLLPGGALCAGGVALQLSSGAQGVAAVMLILGAVLLGLGFIALVLWFLIRFLLTSQVVALEDGGPLHVFRRTDALSSGRVEGGVDGLVKVRLMILVTIIGALLLVVGVVSMIPTAVLGLIYGASLQPGQTASDVVPPAVLVPAELLQVILGALFAPLYVVFQVVFYVDMRVRREGLDLELKLAA
ncbi:MAG: hypothetical protein AB1938_05080 [Myxococcota bacterium]